MNEDRHLEQASEISDSDWARDRDHPYLAPNFFVDSDHAEISAYVDQHALTDADQTSNIVGLYYAIRDGFRYNPWRLQFDREAFRASNILLRNRAEGAHCIDKANLLAACARRIGVPSRLHFANVRNHIGTQELERQLGTDLLVFHGYVGLYLDNRWVAATPAFNKELCDHLGVSPLEFDGSTDSIFQEYDRRGNRFMEYLHDHGAFPDIPYDEMIAQWKRYYSSFLGSGGWPSKADSGGDLSADP